MANRKKTTKLVCPQCGWDGSTDGRLDGWFRLVETQIVERRVDGLTADGALDVADDDGVVLVGEHDELRLKCGECGRQFRIPGGISVKSSN